MTNNVKILAIDFGNSTICVVYMDSNGEKKRFYIPSTYTDVVNSLTTQNVVEIDNMKIQFAPMVGGKELRSGDKTKRIHMRHQVLLAAYKAFGPGKHYIKLSTGLPLIDFKNEDKKSAFKAMFDSAEFTEFKGMVDGYEVSVNLGKRTVINGECLSAIKGLAQKIPNDLYGTIVYDVGMETTEALVAKWQDGKLKVSNPVNSDLALSSVYQGVFEEAKTLGAVASMTELDKFVNAEATSIRAENGEFDLSNSLKSKIAECGAIIKDINNQFDFPTNNMSKIFLGGGSNILLNIIEGKSKIHHHIQLDKEDRYYANVEGYYLAAK